MDFGGVYEPGSPIRAVVDMGSVVGTPVVSVSRNGAAFVVVAQPLSVVSIDGRLWSVDLTTSETSVLGALIVRAVSGATVYTLYEIRAVVRELRQATLGLVTTQLDQAMNGIVKQVNVHTSGVVKRVFGTQLLNKKMT